MYTGQHAQGPLEIFKVQLEALREAGSLTLAHQHPLGENLHALAGSGRLPAGRAAGEAWCHSACPVLSGSFGHLGHCLGKQGLLRGLALGSAGVPGWQVDVRGLARG